MRLSSLLRFRAFCAMTFFSALLFVLVVPGCGRSSLEIETLDATAEGGSCGPSTCPNGCCDRLGTCRIGADTQACGSRGQQCSDCLANGFTSCDVPRGKVCARATANCGPESCTNGCCSFQGGASSCLAGTDPSACGNFGSACTDCSVDGRSCDTNTRNCGTSKCDATNCKGCCVGDQCLSGQDNQACGTTGNACTSCTQTGQTCAPAGSGGACTGTPTCSPANCGGCCNGNVCVAGTDSIACGKQGQACSNCAAGGQTCVAQGLPNERTCQAAPACGPANCAGCCVGNACIIATTRAACGVGGAACKVCGANDSCNAGTCVPPPNCGPANCAGGCCIGADVCAGGAQDTACGVGGAQCTNCAGQAKVCQAGACQNPVCGPANCPGGCCSGNTCVTGTADNACGLGGAACSDCGAANQACQAKACRAKCGPANCAGCCGAGNVCGVGFSNAACGSGGAACTNCTAAASTCNTLALPRLCANQAGLCPAAYGACGAGVTTAVQPSLQGVCDDVVDLDAIQAACAMGPDVGTCIAAFQVLAATNPACSACIAPFNEPFNQGTGVYRCAAPFVSAACNHSTGCATDCQDVSCTQCPAGNEDQCRTTVVAGQCNVFSAQAACVAPALGPGALCNPATYASFGGWLRAVGDHFCGNGP